MQIFGWTAVQCLDLTEEGFERFNVACPRSVLKQAFEQLEAAVNSL